MAGWRYFEFGIIQPCDNVLLTLESITGDSVRRCYSHSHGTTQ
jgi:hypothetical protein